MCGTMFLDYRNLEITGIHSADGNFVELGFRPALVID